MATNLTSALTIVTASWYTALPSEFIRVGISRGAPRRHPAGYRRYPPLYPGGWYSSVSDDEYVSRYEQVLARLDPHQVLRDLQHIGAGAPVALLCFEQPETSDGWCHRSLAGMWLADNLKMPVPEFGFEHLTQERHPMLPPSFRRVPTLT